MYKIAKILAIILGVVGVVLWVTIARTDDPGSSSTIDIMINLGKYMTILAAIVALLFTVGNLVTHPSKLKKALISIGVFALIVVISYAVSSGTDVDLTKMAERGIETSESASKTVGAGLIAFYILGGLAVLSMVFSGFKKVR
ncbi:hypothetical protein SAMN04487906_3053 [Zhouia amylolytica]|uniref:Uncharacterized protein n=2 Tax=Zhouia amylolytica TaxID=376730 RepID=W2UJU1_9FLAO|nr:hypothetical protein [Zhouia amylolytica]ETN94435.1 hypothetical protein P278_23780 [Zhouia amylolytica AD3]MCQ0110340.1 hypothetical protein [Zhouia amylolytica]SFT12067.1 hypothetical protein SAMN04487906_3053 [Zhouia amylolytica]